MLNKYMFRLFYTRDYIKTMDFFAKSLREKVILSFGDLSEEAGQFETETFDRLARRCDPEWFDPGDIADQVHDAGVDFYVMAQGVMQGIINMFTTALWHLFEQQLLTIHRRELLQHGEERNPNLLKLDVAHTRLLAGYGINFHTFASWSKLYELSQVAHTVKHADGSSCTRLKALRPDLFVYPGLGGVSANHDVEHRNVYRPLSGEDLYVRIYDFTGYVDAVKLFWEELATAIDSLPDS